MTRPAAAALAALAALGSPRAAASPPPGTPPAATGYASCLERGPAAGAAAPGPAPAEAAARERDLEEAAGWARRLEEMAREYRQEIQLLVERKYDQRRRALSERYERAIRSLEAQDRQEREDAIAQLLALLSRYPDDPGVAPDAMFRLAELRMEAADDEYARQLADWRERVGTAVAAGRDPPDEPVKDYAPSIALYRRIMSRFPGYPFLHGIHYLLGYCLGEMGKGEEARRTFLALVDRYPQSPYAPEAWLRLGDGWFDEPKPGALQRAADAYSRLEAWPAHLLYPRALYKLGWTWYRLDDLGRAVESFVKLLDFHVEEARRSGRPPSGDVWPEAVQYVAISFSDPRWGGVPRARAFFESRGGRPYQAEIYRRLGDLLFDQGRYQPAVEAWQLAIASRPLSPDAPRLQARIVTAWQREGRFDREAEARERLVADYEQGSAWWSANQGDPDLMTEVRDLWEASLSRAAGVRHAQAQAHKKEGRLDLAVAEYRQAARAYGAYLARFPHSRNAQELAYRRADCLYNAGEFARAAQAYGEVRDDPAGGARLAEAGLAAVIAWESEVARLRAAGQIPDRRPPRPGERAPGAPPRPEPLPPALAGLVRASDALLARLPDHPQGPAIAYKAAEVFYAWDQLDEARCRFDEVVSRWPAAEVARYAANLLVESYLSVEDWASVEQTAARLRRTPVARDASLAAALQRLELGGRFNRATQLMARRQYDEAGRLFASLADEDPRPGFADKALYNAASCFEAARRFETALRLYERVQADYPASSFADEALFRVAWNAENTYDLDKAVDRYLRLVERYPGSRRRQDALYNAARSLESLQSYRAAGRAFARYARLYPGAEDAARAQYRAALVHEKAREWPEMVRALRDFQGRFGRSPEPELLVESYLKLASAWSGLGNRKAARQGYRDAVAEFHRRGLEPGAHPAAAAAAAEAQFRLAELDLERFDRIRLPETASQRKLMAALQAKLAEMKKVASMYHEVKGYGRPDWTLAAFYRQAWLLERLAQALYQAPPPPEYRRKGREEYLAAYQDQLAQAAQPYEDQAVAVYVQALEAARQLRLKNEWTRKINESLARHRPREYPVPKEPKGRLLLEDRSPAPLLPSPRGARPQAGPVARLGGAPAPTPPDAEGQVGPGRHLTRSTIETRSP